MTRVQVRLKEAQRAGKRAEAAFVTLQSQLAKGIDPQDVQSDVDRLEVTTLDFRRRITSAQDAAKACPNTAEVDTELEQLNQRAEQMLQAVKQIRQNGGTLGPDTDLNFDGRGQEK